MKILVLITFFSFGYLFGQETISDTIKISRLSDNQVKEMIQRCWSNVKNTIYYGEYYEGIKYGCSKYETFLDSNNLELGPVLIMKTELNTKILSYEITEQETYQLNQIYQLVSPYELILMEENNIKNGTVISTKTEKTGDFYTSTFNDGLNTKKDTLREFSYSLNEDWAQWLFGIDTIYKINTVLEATNNMDFENHKTYSSQTKLIKRETPFLISHCATN